MKSTVARLTDHPALRTARDRLTLPDGASAAIVQDALEVRDRSGALLIRYADGHAEVYAPGGDLTLAAPRGRVVVRAATELSLEAGERMRATAPAADLQLQEASLKAERVVAKVRHVTQQIERYQLAAGQLMEQARDAFRDVRGVLQTRAERMRTIVSGEHTVHAERNVQVSREDTCIDGKRILLG